MVYFRHNLVWKNSIRPETRAGVLGVGFGLQKSGGPVLDIIDQEDLMELNVKYDQPNARISIRGDIDDDGAAVLKNKTDGASRPGPQGGRH